MKRSREVHVHYTIRNEEESEEPIKQVDSELIYPELVTTSEMIFILVEVNSI